jgi:rhodanese-related sulfurtransferase
MGLLRQGALLVDVRENDEWQAGHAPEATHVPLSDLESRIIRVPRTQQLVIICRSGRRSDFAAASLRQAGYDAYNFSGGMHAWQQAGGAVLTSTGQPGSVI